MPLCKVCCSLDFAAISRSGNIEHFREGIYGPQNDHLFWYDFRGTLDDAASYLTPYHQSIETLQQSAEICDLCHLIRHGVDVVAEAMDRTVELKYNMHYSLDGLRMWLVDLKGADGFQVLGLGKGGVKKDSLRFQLVGGIAFCVENDSQLRQVVRRRKILPSPRSPVVLDKIQSWLSQCREQHGHKTERPGQGPSRVLEIMDNAEKIVLRSFNKTSEKYACLSYCWGSAQPITLTVNNLATLRNGMRVSDLSQTYQDAIWLTDQLGLRYLWIDSFCILQDDPEDWRRESAQMGATYRNSALTIAVDKATGISEGFLDERKDHEYVPIPLRTAHASGDASAFSIPIKTVPSAGEYHLLMEDEPLSKRGWALQERFLSPRTLHYGQTQIFFECSQGFLAEDSCSGWHQSFEKFISPHGRGFMLDSSWYKIVQLYSKRRLSRNDDKLPALAGMAGLFKLQTVHYERYLAGLWSRDLVRGLCWSVNHESRPAGRPQKYRAPTWSWASVDGSINFYLAGTVQPAGELASVIDAHVDLESAFAPCGKVVGGWILTNAIRIQLHMKHGECGPRTLRYRHGGVEFRMFMAWDSESYLAPEEGMAGDLYKDETKLFAVPLVWRETPWLGPFCIIVKAAIHKVDWHKRVPGFQRVGAGVLQWSPEYKEGKKAMRLMLEEWKVLGAQGKREEILLL